MATAGQLQVLIPLNHGWISVYAQGGVRSSAGVTMPVRYRCRRRGLRYLPRRDDRGNQFAKPFQASFQSQLTEVGPIVGADALDIAQLRVGGKLEAVH